ncbi:MAG: hypothetical protein JO135_09130 [Candidatus Eremiobacteraeota bacterium]|nr:hypothetical protein [Candidatus Eremiobacteraeota bacterium]
MRFLILTLIAVCAMSLGTVPAPVRAASPTPVPAASMPPENPSVTQIARAEIDAWESGKVDRSKYSAEANQHITNDLITNVSKQMAPLGPPTSFKYVGHATQFGLDLTQYEAVFPQITLTESIAVDPAGKIAFIYFSPKQ